MDSLISRLSFVVSLFSILVTSIASAETEKQAAETKPLPEAIASFGAVTSDGWIYVYSGHIGRAHAHSKDNLSQFFRRRPVQGGPWEELPMETPLQGLALVAHNGLIYRVGGMTAKNSADEEADLYSTTTFARFDPQSKQWTHLSPLPTGRSSHDAVLIGSKIFVVGGWELAGEEEGNWHTDILVFDLQKPEQGWQTKQQPFERRALAASHNQGKLYAIGGMSSDHDIDRSVNIYDPSTDSWAKGPQLPGEGMNGFGASAWNNGDTLLVSGSNGVIYQLSKDGRAWEEAAQLTEPRFFHQLVPANDDEILAMGGASMKGHLTEIERIRLEN